MSSSDLLAKFCQKNPFLVRLMVSRAAPAKLTPHNSSSSALSDNDNSPPTPTPSRPQHQEQTSPLSSPPSAATEPNPSQEELFCAHLSPEGHLAIMPLPSYQTPATLDQLFWVIPTPDPAAARRSFELKSIFGEQLGLRRDLTPAEFTKANYGTGFSPRGYVGLKKRGTVHTAKWGKFELLNFDDTQRVLWLEGKYALSIFGQDVAAFDFKEKQPSALASATNSPSPTKGKLNTVASSTANNTPSTAPTSNHPTSTLTPTPSPAKKAKGRNNDDDTALLFTLYSWSLQVAPPVSEKFTFVHSKNDIYAKILCSICKRGLAVDPESNLISCTDCSCFFNPAPRRLPFRIPFFQSPSHSGILQRKRSTYIHRPGTEDAPDASLFHVVLDLKSRYAVLQSMYNNCYLRVFEDQIYANSKTETDAELFLVNVTGDISTRKGLTLFNIGGNLVTQKMPRNQKLFPWIFRLIPYGLFDDEELFDVYEKEVLGSVEDVSDVNLALCAEVVVQNHSLDSVFDLLFGDHHGKVFWHRMHTDINGDFDISFENWKSIDPAKRKPGIVCKCRGSYLVHPVHTVLGHHKSKVSSTHKVVYAENGDIAIIKVSRNDGIPFGETFEVVNVWNLSQLANNAVRIESSVATRILKRVLFSGTIEKSTKSNMTTWSKTVCQHISDLMNKNQQQPATSREDNRDLDTKSLANPKRNQLLKIKSHTVIKVATVLGALSLFASVIVLFGLRLFHPAALNAQ